MTRGMVESIVDQLAAELSRSVVINDPAVEMIYASPHYGDADRVRVDAVLNHRAEPRVRGYILAQGVSTWTRSGVIPANDELGMHARLCFPVRWQGRLLALVMVMDPDNSITPPEIGRIEEGVADLGFAMHAVTAPAEAAAGEPTVTESTVLDLVRSDAGVRGQAVRAVNAAHHGMCFDLVTAAEIAVTGESSTTPAHVEVALRQALAAQLRRDRSDMLFAVTPSAAVVVLGKSLSTTESTQARVTAVVELVQEFASGRFACTAGIGDTVEGLTYAATSFRQAQLARHCAELGLRPRVAGWPTLGAYGPVLAMPADRLSHDALPQELQRLRHVDPDGQLAATLRAYLDAAGNGPVAAARLHVHRTTLYYRLGRIHDLTGLDVNDGATRLACHLGFVMLDVMDAEARL